MSTQDANRADAFLRLIRRARRGRLKIYLGYAAGVGKTYQMLLEGRRLKEESIDVVVGLVETHGRVDTEKLLEGLEVIPRRRLEYRGIELGEMDVDAILARKPHVVLIDELAHTNAPESRNEKRYEDVQDVLAAGIHVITTLNVQHLESLYDTVEKAIGVRVRERIPDSVIAEADQIVNVDVSSEDLRQRLREGKVYTPERIEVALEHFFKESSLEQLRELTLRELASQIDLRRREAYEEEPGLPDQVMVGLSSRGPNSERLLRYGYRMAGRLNRNWYAVYVRTPSEGPTAIDSETQRMISETLTLAKQLGAIVFTYNGDDVVQTLLQFAKEYRVGHIVIGSQRAKSVWARLLNRAGMVERLLASADGITVTVLDTREREGLRSVQARPQPSLEYAPPEPEAAAVVGDRPTGLALTDLMSADRIVIWNEPVSKMAVLAKLTETAGPYVGELGALGLLDAVLEREEQGSTFLNEGVALPHARIPKIPRSLVAVGLTRRGISDVPGDTPIEMVFLIVSPSGDPDEQVRILALASRAAQSRQLREHLRLCTTPDDVIKVMVEWKADD